MCVYLCRLEPGYGGVRLRLLRLFGKKLTLTFMIPLMADTAGPYEQTTRLKLQRGVSWARVPKIVLQNDPALFRPKSKKMTRNSMVTFNVVTS